MCQTWRTLTLTILATVTLGAGTAPLAAQRRGLREVREWGTAGGALALAIPTGQMGEFVDVAGGLDGFLAVNLGRGSPLALRFEGAVLVHQLSYDAGLLIVDVGGPFGSGGAVSLRTRSGSFITSLRAGPQLTLGDGAVQLYGVLLGGVSYFSTTYGTAYYDCGCGYYDTWDHVTLSGDVTLGWETGGGLRFRLGRRSWLDLGARYVRHDDARYLAAGPDVDGTSLWQEVHGPADMVTVKAGMSVGLR